jgi:hypothetical protein
LGYASVISFSKRTENGDGENFVKTGWLKLDAVPTLLSELIPHLMSEVDREDPMEIGISLSQMIEGRFYIFIIADIRDSLLHSTLRIETFFSFLVVPETSKRRHHQPARLRRLKVKHNGNQSNEKLPKARGNADVVKRLRSKLKTSEKRLLKKDKE